MNVLTPQLTKSGRHLPCATLRELASNPAKVCTGKRSHRRALILAALQLRFAQVLCPREVPQGNLPRRFRETYAGVCLRSNLELQVFGIGQGLRLDVNPRLARLASYLSPNLLDQALIWAPPVVAPGQGKHPPFVVANQVSFALHRYLYPGEVVSVQMLNYRPGWQLSPADLAQGVIQAFFPMVNANRNFVIRACSTGKEASVLSGLGTTRCGEIRQQLGLLTI